MLVLLNLLSACGWSEADGLKPAPTEVLSVSAAASQEVTPTSSFTPAPASTPSIKTVEFEPIDGYIPNPFMGWQDSRLRHEILPETVGYDRFNWSDLNPARGDYDWRLIETLRKAKAGEGKHISFRIRTARPAPFGPGPVIPSWVAALGVQMYSDGGSGLEPLYHDCIYLDTHAEFVNALRQRYDGDPDVAFIDIGSYGSFGEWDSDQYSEEIDSLDWHARRRIADMYIGGSGVRPCLDSDGEDRLVEYTYEGFQETQLIMPFTPWFEDSLIYVLSERDDVGIRQDSLGSERHQAYILERSAELIESRWPHAPIVFEFAPNAYTEEALERARQFAVQMHTSYVHDNLDGRGELDSIEDVVAPIGYKLVLKSVAYQDKIQSPDLLPVQMEWLNTGSAPPYFDADLTFIFVAGEGEVVASEQVDIELRSFLPNQPRLLEAGLRSPGELPAGLYEIKFAVIADDGHSFVQLAISGEDAQGYYSLGFLEVAP